ncbi:MAG: shikimate kinase [Candidatus Omnitrophota bacterium]|nr:shikimate kinase [Candidatus Omnitrophota bacterium]
MNIILTGFMGTGKTAVGRRLAKRLGWRFVDVDALIEAGAKKSVATIFAEHGEGVFRRLERRTILRAIRARHQVIATGGGAFVDAQNRARLRVSGPVICLTARPRTILARVGARLSARPLLRGAVSPLTRVRTLLTQRARAYAQADLTIDTSALSIDEVVERLWSTLSPCLCRGWQYVQDHSKALAHRYGGKYIVVADGRIIASGETQLEAYQNARRRHDLRGKPGAPRLSRQQETGIYYIPLPEEALTAL